jgi:hypothetical protein
MRELLGPPFIGMLANFVGLRPNLLEGATNVEIGLAYHRKYLR